jgi:hypothetical protein
VRWKKIRMKDDTQAIFKMHVKLSIRPLNLLYIFNVITQVSPIPFALKLIEILQEFSVNSYEDEQKKM